jgi:hypothetical protein
VRFALAISVCVLGTGCFSPEFEDGTIACGEAGCPSGLTCADDGYCYASPPGEGEQRSAFAVSSDGGNNRVYAYCGGDIALAWTEGDARTNEAVSWGDRTEDGVPELAVAAGDDGVLFYKLASDGPYLWQQEYMPMARDVAWGRFDQGTLDLAVASSEGVRVLAPHDEYIDEEWRSQPHDAVALAVADIDRDGYDDLAIGTRGEGVGVYTANGGGLHGMWWSDPGDAYAIAFGDSDGDDLPDVVTGASGRAVSLGVNRGDWFEYVWEGADPLGATSVAWADVDSDGDLDLAVGSDHGAGVIVYTNLGGGVLEPQWVSDEVQAVRGLDWADYDGDGDPDLLAAGDGVRVYRNGGGSLSLAWSDAGDYSDAAWAIWNGGPDPCTW